MSLELAETLILPALHRICDERIKTTWPVCMKAETMWTRWCEMNKGREVKVEGVRIKRRGSVVWIAGGLERTVRQVGRAERVVGEVWRVRVGTGRDGQGRDGPWKGAAELRRKRTRGVLV